MFHLEVLVVTGQFETNPIVKDRPRKIRDIVASTMKVDTMDVRLSTLALLAGVSTIGLTTPLFAQTAPAPDEQSANPSIKDIVVTARRVEERLQDVPLAVTALTSETLRSRNVATVSDLRLVTPSLQITPSIAAGSSTPGITLRGQRQSRVLFGQDQSVAIYVNEVPQTRPQGLDATTYDLQSVQVLKGPQGTLFGKNTTGGALVITPRKPTDQFEGFVQGQIGNYDWREVSGAVNLPLVEGVALRVAGNIVRRDGYAINRITGQDLYDKHSESFRASLLLGGTGAVESLTIVDGFYNDSNGLIGHITFINPVGLINRVSGGAALASQQRVAGDIFAIEGGALARDRVSSTGISNVTTFELSENITLKNVAGYRQVKTNFMTDYDDTAATVIEGTTRTSLKWGSEELQAIGTFDGFKMIAGVFYYKEKGFDYGGPNISFRPPGTNRLATSGGRGRNSSKSVFAQADIDLTETLGLTVGGRYTWDFREITAQGHTEETLPTPRYICLVQNADGSTQPANDAGCRRTVSKKFSDPTYNISLNWKFAPNNLLYVAHRRGYRAGGFNIRAQRPGQFTPFDPEVVKDVELGLKSDFELGGVAFRANLAAYRQWYKDIQRTVNLIVNAQLSSTVLNAASAHIDGGEAELTIVPFENFMITAFGSITDAKYQSFTDPASGADLSRNKFADVPQKQGSVTATYSVPLRNDAGELSFSGTIYSQSGFQLSDINDPTGVAPGYTLFDARAQWRDVLGTNVDVAAIGKNLTNKRYAIAGSAQTAAGYSYVFPGPPRMYGVEVRYSF